VQPYKSEISISLSDRGKFFPVSHWQTDAAEIPNLSATAACESPAFVLADKKLKILSSFTKFPLTT
jgi:hypothetical protein